MLNTAPTHNEKPFAAPELAFLRIGQTKICFDILFKIPKNLSETHKNIRP